MTKNNRNTLILLALLGLVLVISYPYLNPKTEDTTVVENRLAAVEEAVTLLNKVQAISLDFGVFESREFGYLNDLTLPLLNLPVGRSNPFAPTK